MLLARLVFHQSAKRKPSSSPVVNRPDRGLIDDRAGDSVTIGEESNFDEALGFTFFAQVDGINNSPAKNPGSVEYVDGREVDAEDTLSEWTKFKSKHEENLARLWTLSKKFIYLSLSKGLDILLGRYCAWGLIRVSQC